jgi:hypothetical protein
MASRLLLPRLLVTSFCPCSCSPIPGRKGMLSECKLPCSTPSITTLEEEEENISALRLSACLDVPRMGERYRSDVSVSRNNAFSILKHEDVSSLLKFCHCFNHNPQVIRTFCSPTRPALSWTVSNISATPTYGKLVSGTTIT